MKISNLFIQNCCLCSLKSDNPFYALCQRCEALFSRPNHLCQQCALPCDAPLCGECLFNPPLFQRTISCFSYEEPLSTLIQDYKFHQKLFLTPIFGKLMIKTLQHAYHEKIFPETIIPMPIHPKRLRERGYHQTNEFAKIIAKNFSIPIDLKLCQRIKHTPPQSSVPFSERKQNMRHVFRAKHTPYQHIAIIDDVMTTGETVSSLCKIILQKNPFIKIDIWCLARTIKSINHNQ